ncbi:MAG: GldG family protein [Gammaproteobacteria bacterium]|nr:GldG family protein [Gammaproteobacteria bacterium]
MITTPEKKRQLRIQSYIFNLLFLAIIALIAWFSTQYSFTSDWTYGSRNSLTDSSINLLKSMPEPIKVHVYLPEKTSTRMAIEELLKRYQRHKDNFEYKILNPDLDIEFAKAENITRYGQVVVKYNNKKETLDNFNESIFGNALSRLSRSFSPHAVFLSGHGERNPLSSENTGYNKLATTLMQKGIRISVHNLLSGSLPEDTSIVIIAGASHTYLPGEVERLQQYIKVGGNLLWLQDPDTDNNLTSLASQLKLSFSKGILVDADPQLRATLQIEHPATIAVLQYNLHKITQKIPYNTLFMLAGGVDFIPTEKSDWEGTTLFSSRESTWSETGTLLSKQIDFEKDKGDTLGPLPMAQALQRVAPLQKQSIPENEKQTQRIVVVADSDFLSNSYIGAGANLMLGENIVNWLAQDEQLLSFEIKSAPDLQLKLSDTQVTLIGIGFLVIMPAGLLLCGMIIWRRRKRR